jgi:hypothetical protein
MTGGTGASRRGVNKTAVTVHGGTHGGPRHHHSPPLRVVRPSLSLQRMTYGPLRGRTSFSGPFFAGQKGDPLRPEPERRVYGMSLQADRGDQRLDVTGKDTFSDPHSRPSVERDVGRPPRSRGPGHARLQNARLQNAIWRASALCPARSVNRPDERAESRAQGPCARGLRVLFPIDPHEHDQNDTCSARVRQNVYSRCP